MTNQRKRGISFAVSMPELAAPEKNNLNLSKTKGKLNLREIIGEDTQELIALENLVKQALLNPESRIRKVCRDALKMCTLEIVNGAYIEGNKIFIKKSMHHHTLKGVV